MEDEREHRRGLILGLTLAEVMMLLLFLLMLALGAQVKKAQDNSVPKSDYSNVIEEKKSLQNVNDKLRAQMIALRRKNAPLKNPSSNPIITGSTRSIWDEPPIRSGLDEVKNVLGAMPPRDPEAPPVSLGIRKKLVSEKLGKLLSILSEASKVDEKCPTCVLVVDENPSHGAGKEKPPQSAEPKGQEPDMVDKGKHDWPPIIILSEADGYFFSSGSSALDEKFERTVSDIVVPKLLEMIKKFGVNVIEVVGHTDEEPMGSQSSNLDKMLIPVLNGDDAYLGKLKPADNAGLGLARATTVVRLLLKDKRLSDMRILPYSGAQLIDVGDRLSRGSVSERVEHRRRIEIRVRQASEVSDNLRPIIKKQAVYKKVGSEVPAKKPKPSIGRRDWKRKIFKTE